MVQGQPKSGFCFCFDLFVSEHPTPGEERSSRERSQVFSTYRWIQYLELPKRSVTKFALTSACWQCERCVTYLEDPLSSYRPAGVTSQVPVAVSLRLAVIGFSFSC